MSDSVDNAKNQLFASYAEKHGIYDLFHSTLSKLVIAKPADPYQFLIDTFSKQKSAPAIVVLAPPVADMKDTIEGIVKKYDLVHIHSGNILEKAFQKQTSAGVQAKAFIDKGQLVPEHLITIMIIQCLKDVDVVERGYLLDGFPRTKQQALAMLQAGFIPDHVLDFDVSDAKILRRAQGLRFDPVTLETINLQKDTIARSPVVDARLIVKPSDTMPSIKERLSIYRRYHSAIVDCFKPNYRKFNAENIHESNISQEISEFLGTRPVSNAPRSFRIVIAGLPGSGKTTLAENISQTYGCVLGILICVAAHQVVSPRIVMQQAVSAGVGSKYLPYLEQPNSVPQDLILPAIIERIKRKDCSERGWVLDGFPIRTQEAVALKESGIEPNRVMWMNTLHSTCWTRLYYRRYDPKSSRVVNLKNVPKDLASKDLSNWIHTASDHEEILEARFNEYESTEKELKKVFSVKNESNPTGVFHYIQGEGIGEGDEKGQNPFADTVFELAQSYLIRPVPSITN